MLGGQIHAIFVVQRLLAGQAADGQGPYRASIVLIEYAEAAVYGGLKQKPSVIKIHSFMDRSG